MTILQYYIYANIYIIAFWIFYKICLKNLVYFQTIRIYLISSVIFSLILPLLQGSISNLISYESNFVAAARENIPSITYINTSIENFASSGGGSLNWPGTIEILLLSGVLITLLIHFFRYLKIHDNFSNYTTFGCMGQIFVESTACGQPCGENDGQR